MIERTERTAAMDEPIGIVISRGRSQEVLPRFTAFEWGPAPEGETESASTKAA